MALGERFKMLRGKETQEEFAKKIGVSTYTLQLYEKGSVPKGDILQRINKETGINLHWLLTGENEPVAIPEWMRQGAEAAKEQAKAAGIPVDDPMALRRWYDQQLSAIPKYLQDQLHLTREPEAPYRRQPERMLAGGELRDVTLIEPAAETPLEGALKTITLLVNQNEKKDRENEELRRKVADLERRLAATGEGRRNTDRGGQPEPV